MSRGFLYVMVTLSATLITSVRTVPAARHRRRSWLYKEIHEYQRRWAAAQPAYLKLLSFNPAEQLDLEVSQGANNVPGHQVQQFYVCVVRNADFNT